MKKVILIIFVGNITCSLSVLSQVATQTNLLRVMSQQESINYTIKKAKAVEWAKKKGIPVKIKNNGSMLEIQHIDKNGRPHYYKTDNINAAATISTNKVYPGGSAGLSLTGSGITVREWDAGSALSNHQEFGNRVTLADSASSDDHSTHVAGTIMAAGVRSSAKGMAYGASLRSFDWNSDVSEMASEAASGALISNHSYGWVMGWHLNDWYGDTTISNEEDYLFGFYDTSAMQWDLIAQNAPYFLICKAAGNDRGDSGVGHPADGPYDCMGQNTIAKNILTVGAVNDIPGGYTIPSGVVMTSFSSWGPVDDGRIKPDIVANGVSLYSTYNIDSLSYTTMSGTSMATPSVAGSLALLQQHYYALKGDYMRSATAKALIIHTANEAGPNIGPDYMFGWGLMNTKNAALKISEDQSTDVINELTLNNEGSYTRNVIASGTEPLKVTIVWTDPAGTPVEPSLDPITPMLVNDLDLSITQSGSTFYPWKLDRDNPGYPATNNSKNSVDNVEVIYIANPVAGNTYTLSVGHTGILSGGSQPYSMIISGITNVVPTPKITVTMPNGGEAWEVGTTINITWTSSRTSGTLKIEYSTNNGTSWANILTSTPDDGSQLWTIPNTPSSNCLIRISDTGGSTVDVSNALFSIVTPAPRTLIANYPLISNANDITGNNNPMTLVNAPFQNDGIYCNGIYDIADPVNGCKVTTPYKLTGFNINSFEISIDFMLTELLQATSSLPVFVGGSSYRWIGFCHYYDNGNQKISLLTNNSSYTLTQTTLNLNQWYNAKIVYNGITAFLYLNNQLICSKDATLLSNGDYNIGATNYSSGKVFKGYLKNLKVSTINSSPEIKITAPNGGENWQVSSIHNISWTSYGTSGTVKIEYSITNDTAWTNIIESTPDNGSYSWTIPDSPATNCLVRVSDTDGRPLDISNGPFTILHLMTPIFDIQHDGKIKVYPNPVSGILNIEYLLDEYKELHIINSQGSILKVQKIISPRQQLDFSNYKYGIYFLEFIKSNGESKRIKVLHR